MCASDILLAGSAVVSRSASLQKDRSSELLFCWFV